MPIIIELTPGLLVAAVVVMDILCHIYGWPVSAYQPLLFAALAVWTLYYAVLSYWLGAHGEMALAVVSAGMAALGAGIGRRLFGRTGQVSHRAGSTRRE